MGLKRYFLSIKSDEHFCKFLVSFSYYHPAADGSGRGSSILERDPGVVRGLGSGELCSPEAESF